MQRLDHFRCLVFLGFHLSHGLHQHWQVHWNSKSFASTTSKTNSFSSRSDLQDTLGLASFSSHFISDHHPCDYRSQEHSAKLQGLPHRQPILSDLWWVNRRSFSCVENTRHNCSLYSHACRGTWCCYSIENSLFTNFLRKKINRSSKFCIMSSFFWKKRIVCLCFRDFSGNCFGYSRGSQSRVQRMSLKTRSLETTPLR